MEHCQKSEACRQRRDEEAILRSLLRHIHLCIDRPFSSYSPHVLCPFIMFHNVFSKWYCIFSCKLGAGKSICSTLMLPPIPSTAALGRCYQETETTFRLQKCIWFSLMRGSQTGMRLKTKYQHSFRILAHLILTYGAVVAQSKSGARRRHLGPLYLVVCFGTWTQCDIGFSRLHCNIEIGSSVSFQSFQILILQCSFWLQANAVSSHGNPCTLGCTKIHGWRQFGEREAVWHEECTCWMCTKVTKTAAT